MTVYDFTTMKTRFQINDDKKDDDRDINAELRTNYLEGKGAFTVNEKSYNSLDPTANFSIGTDYTCQIYYERGGQFIPGAVLDQDGEQVEMTTQEDDVGFAWVVYKIPSGKSYYFDYSKTLANDAFYTGKVYRYFDIDSDDKKDFCLKYDFRGHSIPASGYPEIPLKGYLLTYDSGAAMINLANSTGIGAGASKTVTHQWYLTISAVKKAIAIYKVQLVATTTDETAVRLKKLEIPGRGTWDVSRFSSDQTSTQLRWTYTFTSTFDGALYLTRAANDNLNQFEMNTEIEYLLTGTSPTGDIQITLNVYYLVAQTEAGATLTDSLYATIS
jgi:hypothetical protein